MIKNLKTILPYLLIDAIAFYILPYFIKDTGSGMLVLLIIIPTLCFITSLFYGRKHSISYLYGLMVMLIFIPTLLIFYNESAAIYIVFYGLVSFIGNFLGSIMTE